MSMIGSTWDDAGCSIDPGMPGSPRREALNKIVDDVIDNLYGRAGFDDMWDSVEEDIRDEIRNDLAAIIIRARAIP